MTPIVGIHGIGNYEPNKSPRQSAETLSLRWTVALQAGSTELFSSTSITVSYYSHHLKAQVSQSGIDPDSLSENELEMVLGWAAASGAPSEIAQGILTAPVRRAMDWIARHYGYDNRIVHLFLAIAAREVAIYFSDQKRREAAVTEVLETIRSAGSPIVIAHSLGSVVAFEALSSEPGLNVPLLVTLGSPLATPGIVFDKLCPCPIAGKGSRPRCVRRWINISDPGDFIAVPIGLASFFGGVTADLTAPIGTFDMHKVTNYLKSPVTANALAAAI